MERTKQEVFNILNEWASTGESHGCYVLVMDFPMSRITPLEGQKPISIKTRIETNKAYL